MNKIKFKIFAVIILLAAILTINLLPGIFYKSGRNYLAQGRNVKAYKKLKTAYMFKPANKDYRYYYVKVMSNLKPTEKIQKEMFEISQSEEKDSAQKLAASQIETWKSNILYNIGNNYIEQAPFDKNLIRWDTKTFPLLVKIEEPKGTPEYYKTEVEKAFRQWSDSTGFLKFQFTDKNNAQIIVKFNPLPKDVCKDGNCKYVVAYTNPKINGRTLKNMTITMYDKDANGNFFSDKELYNTILHEIGHALGIMGHSYSSDDLMYMSSQQNNNYTRYRSDFQFLSHKDLNTINLLYKLIPNISNTPMTHFNKDGLIYAPIVLGNETEIGNRKLKEAENYIKSAPELPGGYIDLAIAYADLKKTKEAIEALRKALELSKSDEEKFVVYYNIAVVYLNNNKLDEAEKYANLARNLQNSEDVNELLSNINHAKAAKKKPFKTQLEEN